jgi:hypothetical protein
MKKTEKKSKQAVKLARATIKNLAVRGGDKVALTSVLVTGVATITMH